MNKERESGHHCPFPDTDGSAFSVRPFSARFALVLSMSICKYVSMCVCCVSSGPGVRACVCTCAHVYGCAHMCLCVCICICYRMKTSEFH